jgi:signal transduction histidine kinase
MRKVAGPALVEAILARRQQIKLRLGIGLGIAAATGAVVGWPLVGGWLAVWYAVQFAEYFYTGRTERRVKAGQPVAAAPALALVIATNTIFNLLAVKTLMSPDPWTMMVGVWLLTGALLNAAAVSRSSRAAYWAAATPTVLLCLATTPYAWWRGAPAADLVGLFGGSSLLLIASLVLRTVSMNALREAKQASEAKSVFLANMSHEIRTPLNGVLGMAHAMAADELPPEQRERLQIIRRSGEALLALLNDVLDISKIEAGKVELEAGFVDFEAMGQELEASFQALCASKDVYLKVETELSAFGRWNGDPTRVRQVLSNLIANAVKFTDRGHVSAVIRHDIGGGVCITVSDTGPGIAAERLGVLFDKFVQADVTTTRRYGGTGLGLSICKELCELMGGTIAVESTLGEGSIFTVRLPLTRAAEAPAETAPETAEAAEAQAFERPLRVLAAEDHETNQAVLKVMLRQVGFEITLVDDGRQAVDAWEREPWDVILMDVQMPVMDGPTATKAIRARERILGRTPVPIIALTANAMSHQVQEYLACGMDAFVSKPLELPALLEAIGEVLDRQAAAEADGQRASQ